MNNIIQFPYESKLIEKREPTQLYIPSSYTPYYLSADKISCLEPKPLPFDDFVDTLSKTETATLGIMMMCGWINKQEEKDCNICYHKDICGIFMKSIAEEVIIDHG